MGITHLLGKIGALKSGQAKVMVVDTYHLFDETMPFLADVEKKYEFTAEVFGPVGISSPRNLSPENFAEFDKKYGANLWKEDIEQYDKVCKVEPFQRGLKESNADIMINGRRRDHGNERAYIDIAEIAPIGGGLAKLNPLAYWTLEDCFDYAAAYGVPLHPSVERGYPSQGDAKDTVPVPDPEGLSGVKGEAGAVKWVKGSGKGALVVVYAPWCQFCQGMEEAYSNLSEAAGLPTYKFRGDEQREFVAAEMNTEAFPTINYISPSGEVIKYGSEDRSV